MASSSVKLTGVFYFIKPVFNCIIMSTIITALLIVISTISMPLIFILLNKGKIRKRKETFFNLFSQEGSKRGLSFSCYEILKSKIIGVDGVKQALLVFDFQNPDDAICVTMKEVKSCTAEKNYDSIVIGTESKPKLEPHLRSIDLKFSFKNNDEPISLSIYDSGINSIYEMQELETKANTWQAVLSKMIVKEQKLRA